MRCCRTTILSSITRFFPDSKNTDACIARRGWQPHHFALYRDDELVAAAPCYVKGNSHGEYVFDWSWAGAYERNGLDYYPKLLSAVPYSPVTGPRLLVGNNDESPLFRQLLIELPASRRRIRAACRPSI